MSEVNRYTFFAYIDEGDNAELDYYVESDGSWVKASDYDQLKADNEAYKNLHNWLKAENERLTNCLKKANELSEMFERKWYLVSDKRDTLREQADALMVALETLAGACRNAEIFHGITEHAKLVIDNYRAAMGSKGDE